MIAWVIFYHASLNCGVIQFGVDTEKRLYDIMSFFMHFFFFSSGYFHKSKSDYIKNKVQKLLIPYVVFTLIGIIVYEANRLYFTGHFQALSIGYYFRNMCFYSNPPCWFLYSLFVINVLCKNIDRVKNRHLAILICASVVFASMLSNKEPIFLGYNNVLLGTAVYLCEYLFRRLEHVVDGLFFIVLYVSFAVSCIIFFPQRIEFVNNYLVKGNYFVCFIYSIDMCVLLIAACKCVAKCHISKPLRFIGENSLLIYGLHRPLLNWIYEPLFHRFVSGSKLSYVIIGTFFCLITLIVIQYALSFIQRKKNRYCFVHKSHQFG